jgi:hypothetical protein
MKSTRGIPAAAACLDTTAYEPVELSIGGNLAIVLRLRRGGVIFDVLGLSVSLIVYITGCVLNVAPRLFGFALDLLSGALGLGVDVAGPLAHLALGSANGIIYCTFYSVLIHDSTSVDSNARTWLGTPKKTTPEV